MLVGVKVMDNTGDEFYIRLNPFHVVKISIANPRNPDEGSYILLRTGEDFFTPEPIDILDKKFNNAISLFSSEIMLQIINEYATSLQPKKRGRPKKV
jgi:hypothetical protein